MRRVFILSIPFVVLGIAATAVGQKGAPANLAKAKPPTFKAIKPILDKSCVGCHNGPKAAHGLDLSTYAKLMKGDHEGKVIIARNPAKSRFVKVLHGKPMLMPPGEPLRKPLITQIEAWIKAGAKEK